MIPVTVDHYGMTHALAVFDLGSAGELKVAVEYQGDRYRRASALWVPKSLVDPVPVLKGFDTYLDARENQVVSAKHIATTTRSVTHAHTIHGLDMRRLLDDGVVKW